MNNNGVLKITSLLPLHLPAYRGRYEWPVLGRLVRRWNALSGTPARLLALRASRHAGLAGAGGVTLIPRFGSALNLNPHLHMLCLDGAHAFRSNRAVFHRARRPTGHELIRLLASLSRRILLVLAHRFKRLCGLTPSNYRRMFQPVNEWA